jgi:carbamoyl-phosphate synthase small subunit
MKRKEATLALQDGAQFKGYLIGAEGESAGEVVFNTSMSGYQEILTDPSYKYQMLTFTYPHIGNVGVNRSDVESDSVKVAGLIVRELSDHYSNYRAEISLEEYLKKAGVTGIGGIDTRALVLHLRTHGSQLGVIGAEDPATLVDKARALPSMEGLNLTDDVTTKAPYDWTEGTWNLATNDFDRPTDAAKRPTIAAIDFGIKQNILRLLVDQGFKVRVFPARATAEEILASDPVGVFLSNGPGDPAAVTQGIATTKALLGKRPIFGICLGHQILGLAVDAPTYKLKFGHRGGNHPVRNNDTGMVEITVQNHGFATDLNRVPKNVRITHMNLNDNTVEGLEIPGANAFSVQYHPEASPGPHDARYLFKKFRDLIVTTQ